MAKRSRGFIARCPNFQATTKWSDRGAQECLAERDGKRFLVVRYRNGNLVAWRVPSRGPITGRHFPISTPQTRSLDRLLDEAARTSRRNDKPRA